MFAKSGRKGNTRKRERKDSDEGEDDGGSAVVRKEKGPVKSALAATTVGQKKKGNDAIYESNRSVMPTIGVDKSATAPSAEELEDMMGDKRGQAGGAAGVADDGLYRGEANRQQLKEKREIINKAANSIGPIKAPTNVRMTCRFDYQPDLCKDWKETGYCGFGDACKFMHDRGDYKAGWEIERDWQAQQEKKKMEEAIREIEGDKKEEVDDGLPFACAICRGPFNCPVETKCTHYFCESCAFAHHAQSRRCFICNEPTFGQFNTAHKLIAKINRLKGPGAAASGSQGAAGASSSAGGASTKAGQEGDDDDEDAFASYKAEEETRNAKIGWQMPGNTFAQGKSF